MKTYNIDNMTKGWFIGDFEPSVFKNPFFDDVDLLDERHLEMETRFRDRFPFRVPELGDDHHPPTSIVEPDDDAAVDDGAVVAEHGDRRRIDSTVMPVVTDSLLELAALQVGTTLIVNSTVMAQ